ncbi:hypothetical protein BVRB_3g064850 [Beta vulgaris subsp. vulgaris]|nr:hypothetical protein BVRB_3g064850 [Beta vulgaris subsp. vulgaris]
MATFTASSQSLFLLNPKTPFFSPFSITPKRTVSFPPTISPLKIRVSSSSISSSTSSSPTLPFNNSPISTSTRTISSIFATLIAVSKLLTTKFHSIATSISTSASPTLEELQKLNSLKSNLLCSVGPLFFAALTDRPRGSLNTPLTVVAAGMAKWLDIYSGVLMVRVLLSWFPNIPWDRQPLSAIRDLCDPYLNLFRNIIPPVFDTLDVSPLLAFAVLGVLGSILSSSF